jgi:hypothetical protein
MIFHSLRLRFVCLICYFASSEIILLCMLFLFVRTEGLAKYKYLIFHYTPLVREISVHLLSFSEKK